MSAWAGLLMCGLCVLLGAAVSHILGNAWHAWGTRREGAEKPPPAEPPDPPFDPRLTTPLGGSTNEVHDAAEEIVLEHFGEPADGPPGDLGAQLDAWADEALDDF